MSKTTSKLTISASVRDQIRRVQEHCSLPAAQVVSLAVLSHEAYAQIIAEIERKERMARALASSDARAVERERRAARAEASANARARERAKREEASANRAGHAEARRQVAADKAKEREQARAARAEARDKEQAEVAERRAARKLRQEAIAKAKATGLTRRKADAVIGRFYQTWSPAHVRPQDTDQCRHLARSYTSEAFQLDAQRYNDACLVFYGTTQQRSAKDLMRTWVLELQQQIQQALSH